MRSGVAVLFAVVGPLSVNPPSYGQAESSGPGLPRVVLVGDSAGDGVRRSSDHWSDCSSSHLSEAPDEPRFNAVGAPIAPLTRRCQSRKPRGQRLAPGAHAKHADDRSGFIATALITVRIFSTFESVASRHSR